MDIFLILFLISFVCLIIGLVRPAVFSKFLPGASRKKIMFVFGGAMVGSFILFGVSSTSSTPSKQVANPTQPQTATNASIGAQNSSSTPPTKQTAQEIIAAKIASALSQKTLGIVSTELSVRGVTSEKDDPGTPKGAQIVTASLDVKNFFDKNALMRDTGRVSAEAFRDIFSSDPSAYDAFVWYYGNLTDRYGNSSSDVMVTYHISKPVFEKINWSGFDESSLCDFLKQEEQLAGVEKSAASCEILANIK